MKTDRSRTSCLQPFSPNLTTDCTPIFCKLIHSQEKKKKKSENFSTLQLVPNSSLSKLHAKRRKEINLALEKIKPSVESKRQKQRPSTCNHTRHQSKSHFNQIKTGQQLRQSGRKRSQNKENPQIAGGAENLEKALHSENNEIKEKIKDLKRKRELEKYSELVSKLTRHEEIMASTYANPDSTLSKLVEMNMNSKKNTKKKSQTIRINRRNMSSGSMGSSCTNLQHSTNTAILNLIHKGPPSEASQSKHSTHSKPISRNTHLPHNTHGSSNTITNKTINIPELSNAQTQIHIMNKLNQNTKTFNSTQSNPLYRDHSHTNFQNTLPNQPAKTQTLMLQQRNCNAGTASVFSKSGLNSASAYEKQYLNHLSKRCKSAAAGGNSNSAPHSRNKSAALSNPTVTSSNGKIKIDQFLHFHRGSETDRQLRASHQSRNEQVFTDGLNPNAIHSLKLSSRSKSTYEDPTCTEMFFYYNKFSFR
jgi:hypothetical protein